MKKKIFNPKIEVFDAFKKPFNDKSEKEVIKLSEKAMACSACTACTACR